MLTKFDQCVSAVFTFNALYSICLLAFYIISNISSFPIDTFWAFRDSTFSHIGFHRVLFFNKSVQFGMFVIDMEAIDESDTLLMNFLNIRCSLERWTREKRSVPCKSSRKH